MGMTNEMIAKIIMVAPKQEAEVKVVDISFGKKQVEKLLGGETVATVPYDDPVAFVSRFYAKEDGLAHNRTLLGEDGQVMDVLAGPFVIVPLVEVDDPRYNELLQKYLEMFKKPE